MSSTALPLTHSFICFDMLVNVFLYSKVFLRTCGPCTTWSFGDEGLPTIPRANDDEEDKNILLRPLLYTTRTQITHTMAPTKRSNQPGAISQMYTSLASPDNRSVVTAVTFFVVSIFATSTPSHSEGSSLRWRKNRNADTYRPASLSCTAAGARCCFLRKSLLAL
jgi:hypothetical protein